MGVALVTKRIMNAYHRSAVLVVHFIVGGAAGLMVKLGTRRVLQCTEVNGHTVRVAKYLKTMLGSSFTVRVLA